MKGYCSALRKMVEMSDVQTVQMPDLSFIHKGKFVDEKGKVHTIMRMVFAHETIVTEAGYHCPQKVFIGDKTPKKIASDPIGQKLVISGQMIDTVKADGSLKTVEEVKTEVTQNEKLVQKDPVADSVGVVGDATIKG